MKVSVSQRIAYEEVIKGTPMEEEEKIKPHDDAHIISVLEIFRPDLMMSNGERDYTIAKGRVLEEIVKIIQKDPKLKLHYVRIADSIHYLKY